MQLLGTTTGVITDVDGKFELAAFPKNEIQISYIGYVTKKVKVGSQKVMSITLAEDAQQLDEVVVTAFGTGQKKETITGSIQSVRPFGSSGTFCQPFFFICRTLVGCDCLPA